MLTEGVVAKLGVFRNYYNNGPILLFATNDKKSVWVACREEFHRTINDVEDKSFYVRPTLDAELIAAFIHRFEEVMNIQPFSVMQRATYKVKRRIEEKNGEAEKEKVEDHDDAMYVQPSPFWTEHPLKLSFLSAAIKIVDFEECIDLDQCQTADGIAQYLLEIDDDYEYFTPTKLATRRFMKGYTKITRSRKKSSGWREVFDSAYCDYKQPKKRIKRILQRP